MISNRIFHSRLALALFCASISLPVCGQSASTQQSVPSQAPQNQSQSQPASSQTQNQNTSGQTSPSQTTPSQTAPGGAGQAAQGQPAQQQTEPAIAPPASESISKPELPESPGTAAQQQQQQQQTPQNPSEVLQQPSGTAAAQRGKISGSALSRPAGVAIAPTKQHRTRSFLIKMGFIAGAGIALGTVAALSAASPSKPPGAP